ncbi:MAG: serine/threonine-protein phosphatase [Verrucomicrobia bacterium]|nr:serine/threonine-protein phosphatase [Verrucomicrobiota bacterium]NBU10665.1 serine/threonine-protein phosphatase [Pseudomonadota bacterium]NDA65113.1 serine/threonine-protein phosphatase [Verrucomicrobiota bacterium]NDB76162.1 serine/threonine-protein phosphatase [Verrucomicrobiota bacterium]NDD36968.1 serine/threonine-protein phosphatase [Verrucomicrobiota bacterium]
MKHPSVSAPPVSLRWSAWTDRGKVRTNNEDSFLALQFDAREVRRLGRVGNATTTNADFAFAVSDGMGGAMAGEFASRIAVEKITTLLPRSFHQSARGLDAGVNDVLAEVFDQIHRALLYVGESYEECAGMATTLSLCWLTPGWLYFGHIGDSRIYYLPKGGGLKQVTHDDTHVGWLYRNGQINEREARTHPRRNVLQKALGGGNQFVDPQVGAVGYEPGDAFLLCTDGLVGGLFDQQLEEMLRVKKAKKAKAAKAIEDNPAQRLVEESVKNDGRDNTTALVIQVS